MMNTDLGRKTLLEILAHPTRWYQGSWAVVNDEAEGDQREVTTRGGYEFTAQVVEPNHCDTTCCFAGLAVLIAHPGAKLLVDDSGIADYVLLPDGSAHNISQLAQDELDLDHWEAEQLFNGTNSLFDIQSVLRRLGCEVSDQLLEHQLAPSLDRQRFNRLN
jgi:hypothetical protein